MITKGVQEDSARDYAYLSRRQDCRYTTHPAENPFMSLKKGLTPPEWANGDACQPEKAGMDGGGGDGSEEHHGGVGKPRMCCLPSIV